MRAAKTVKELEYLKEKYEFMVHEFYDGEPYTRNEN